VTVNGVPKLTLLIGGSVKYAVFTSVAGNVMTFIYTVGADLVDTDGIQLYSTIAMNGALITGDVSGDLLETSFLVPDTSGILIDSTVLGTAPTVGSVSTDNGTYVLGETLVFVVQYSTAVQIASVTGTPRLTLDIGGITKYASYYKGSLGTRLEFRYAIESGLLDEDGIGITPTIDLNGGAIESISGVSANLGFSAPDFTGVLVVSDSFVITSVTPPIDGTYEFGDTLLFSLEFSENVNVSGTEPVLWLLINNIMVSALFTRNNHHTTLEFEYAIDQDLQATGISMQDSVYYGTIVSDSGTEFNRNFIAPDLSGIILDSVRPVI